MKKLFFALIMGIVLFSASYSLARTNYVGYSGAPGSRGACASTCHGTSGGTIGVSGFPAEFTPGITYEIIVSHSDGNVITQFNGSCRVGESSQNAGMISAGTNTATYSVGEETNGVRFSSSNQSEGTFFWLAPEPGTGEVRLYIAGLQGSKTGYNSELVLVATEAISSSIGEEIGNVSPWIALFQNHPNPFNASTSIRYFLPARSNIRLDIYNLRGQRVEVLADGRRESGDHTVTWDASDYPSGTYFYKLSILAEPGYSSDRKTFIRRMILLK